MPYIYNAEYSFWKKVDELIARQEKLMLDIASVNNNTIISDHTAQPRFESQVQKQAVKSTPQDNYGSDGDGDKSTVDESSIIDDEVIEKEDNAEESKCTKKTVQPKPKNKRGRPKATTVKKRLHLIRE